jgi:1-phosphofructokinase
MVAGIVAALCDGGPLDALARLATAFAVGKLRRTGPYLPDPETVRTLAATAAVIPADAWAAAAAAEGR